MKGILCLLAAICLAAASIAALAAETIPQSDNFEGYALGTYAPFVSNGFTTWGDSATTLSGYRYTVIENAELDGNPNNQVAHIVDKNEYTAPNSNNNKNAHLRTNFWASNWPTYGVRDVSADICPLQTNGPFKVTITNGSGWTSAGNWIASVAFGSTAGNTFFPGMTTGSKIGLQKTTASTNAWTNTTYTYSANTWYTVKFSIDVDNKTYRAYIGQHGGDLTELTSGWTSWVTTNGVVTPSSMGGIYFATSNKANEEAELLVDNVSVTPEPSSLLALATGALGLLGLVRRRRS